MARLKAGILVFRGRRAMLLLCLFVAGIYMRGKDVGVARR